MSPDSSNQFLIDLAAAGDAAALATLLQVYEPRLLTYASRRQPLKVRSLASPEDIVQETCYEACRMIHGFVPNGPESFYHWLVRIANLRMKATVQKYRSRRTRDLTNSGDDEFAAMNALEQLATYRRTPSASAAAHEFIFILEAALERLSDDYREVIQHRFIRGLSVEETASLMNRSNEKIYVLASRALKSLRVSLSSASRYM